MLLCPLLGMAQFKLSGKVSGNQQVLSGASIYIKEKNWRITSDAEGVYELQNLPAGHYTLRASFLGFKPFEKQIDLREDTRLDIELIAQAFLADEVTVRSTRAAADAAATFKNIDKKSISRLNMGQDMPFILDNTPGVVVTSDAGAGVGYTGIRIRGSDATRVNITLNGIPYNDSESQGTFWVNMPDFASSVDNIQIQRGVGTSTNGAGAFGGSVNIQTTTGEAGPYAELNNTFGSFNTWKNTVKVGTGLINDRWSFDGRLSRIKSDGFIDRSASDLKSYFFSGAYHGESDLLRINIFSGSEKTDQAWNGIPEARLHGDIAGMQAYIDRNGLSEADAALLLQSGSRTYNSFTYADQTDNYWQNHYQLLYARKLSDKLSFNGALHYTDGRGYYEEYKASQKLTDYGLNPVTIGNETISRTNLIRRRWLDNDFYGFTYGLTYTPLTSLQFNLAGAYNEYKGGHFGQVIYAEYGSNGDNQRHYYDNDGFKSDFNSYLTTTYQFAEKWRVFADLQYRRVYYTVNGTEKNLNTLDIRDALHFFNPKVGISFALQPEDNVYASFSVANKEPGRDDYINVDAGTLPKPERLNNVEAGYRFKAARLSGGINGYGMWYKDQLVITGKINDVGEYYRQNVANSYRMGLELDATWNLSKQFSLLANAALSRNRIKNFTEYVDDYDNGGQQENVYKNTPISFSPSSILSAELVYNPVKNLALSWQAKQVSKQYMDNTGSANRQLDGYIVHNARMGYTFAMKGLKEAHIGLLLNNILDAKYESNGYTYGYFSGGARTTENFYFAQSGINAMLSLNLKF